MYIIGSRKPRKKNRKRSKLYRAKLKATNRRRVNRMAGKPLGRKR